MRTPFEIQEIEDRISELRTERARRKSELLMIVDFFLEICACGLAWYFYGWQMFVVLFLLLWAINIKIRLEVTK